MQRTLLLAAFSLLLSGRSDAPKFAVEEKSSLSKTFDTHMKLESKEIKLFVEGRDEPIHPPGDIHVSVEDTTRIEVTDEYLERAKGRPAKLRRTFLSQPKGRPGTSGSSARLPCGVSCSARDWDVRASQRRSMKCSSSELASRPARWWRRSDQSRQG